MPFCDVSRVTAPNSGPPLFTSGVEGGKTFSKGDTITLKIPEPLGTKPITYQWSKNKKPIQGATFPDGAKPWIASASPRDDERTNEAINRKPSASGRLCEDRWTG